MQSLAYPTPTLAPDPRQMTLDLRPRSRPQPMAFTACCPNCAGVHMTRADYLACVRDRDAVR